MSKLIQLDRINWPSGDYKPLLQITLNEAELCNRLNIKFKNDADDLGPVLVACLRSETFGDFALLKYTAKENEKFIVYCDSKKECADSIEEIKLVLNIEDSEILWSCDEKL